MSTYCILHIPTGLYLKMYAVVAKENHGAFLVDNILDATHLSKEEADNFLRMQSYSFENKPISVAEFLIIEQENSND